MSDINTHPPPNGNMESTASRRERGGSWRQGIRRGALKKARPKLSLEESVQASSGKQGLEGVSDKLIQVSKRPRTVYKLEDAGNML